MFMGPLEATKPWNTEGLAGMNRFLNRIWRLIIDDRTGNINPNISIGEPDIKQKKLLHFTIKKVTHDIEDGDMKFNTSIAQLMIFVNELYKLKDISISVLENLILLLSPFAPHISEELWLLLGHQETLVNEKWPEYNEELTKADKITIVFSVNGKVRGKKEMDINLEDKELEQAALDDESVRKHIYGKNIVKIIIVKNKMVNIVIK